MMPNEMKNMLAMECSCITLENNEIVGLRPTLKHQNMLLHCQSQLASHEWKPECVLGGRGLISKDKHSGQKEQETECNN